MSQGDEMNILVTEDGKCHFKDNLFQWAKMFHQGRKFSTNIAGTKQLNDCDNFTWLSWSSSDEDEEEVDSLEAFFNRKRIKIQYFCVKNAFGAL